MALFGDKFECSRCGGKDKMAFAPMPNELGQRVFDEICQGCWGEWQKKQMQLINHYGLDVTNPDSHTFLFDNLKIFLFNEGVELAEIDTSKEGSVSW
ncbi:MAG TPA: Fe(2+)-trafficking protein [Pyrinomonadaceae bacterium]|nr:Fe(2+)-trafficking protein [Pyrinomonadaceae bacterium]